MARKSTRKKATAKKTTARKPSASAKSPYPKIGTKAPAFTADASDGGTVKLADFKGEKIVVLYFYPRDNTPGCTREACGFRDNFGKLRRAGIEILGVSPDSVASHDKFVAKFELPFTLLSDADHEICEAYGVWQTKTMAGREYKGVVRTTFVIDKQSQLAHVFEKVKPDGHAEEILDWIKANL